MINEKEINKLLNSFERYEKSCHKTILEEWLEQNQPEPVVVGLSDEQAYSLADFIARWGTGYSYFNTIKQWRDSQLCPKPTPQVEVGQVWLHTKDRRGSTLEITVIGINSTDVAYQDNFTQTFGTWSIRDFTLVFKRVES